MLTHEQLFVIDALKACGWTRYNEQRASRIVLMEKDDELKPDRKRQVLVMRSGDLVHGDA